jgi:hypothetical protein
MNPLRILVLATLFATTPCLAQATEPTPPTKVYRLTPEQVEAAKNAGTERPDGPALTASIERDTILNNSLYKNGDAPAGRQIRGEAGFFVGTGGARGIYGSTLVPLGENGTLGLSFSTSRLPGFGYGGFGNGYGGFGNGYGNFGEALGPGY